MAAGDRTYTATVLASGRATVTIATGSRSRRWTVQQVSVEMATAPIGATCDLRKNGTFLTALVPAGDAAGGDPPVTLYPTDTMTVNWANCTPGSVGTVFVIYDEVSNL